ncbi:MAG: hypothetical protein WA231_17895 [Methylocella sp.]
MSITEIEDWLKFNAVPLSVLGGMIVFLTNLWKLRVDYSKDIRKQRRDLIDKLRSQFDDEEMFGNVFDALDDYRTAIETNDEESRLAAELKVRAINVATRDKFCTLLERVALLSKSKVIDERWAHYEFGYYTLLCWKTPPFWDEPFDSENEPYWALFKDFAERMEVCEKELKADPEKTIRRIRV